MSGILDLSGKVALITGAGGNFGDAQLFIHFVIQLRLKNERIFIIAKAHVTSKFRCQICDLAHFMKKLAALNPNCVMAHTNLSVFYMSQGKIQEAEDEKALANQ